MALATAIGADIVVQAAKLDRAVRRAAGCHMIGDTLSSGAHVTIDAVGNSESITDCLRITRPRGRVVLLGMPAEVRLDLTGLWHRETELKGAYTYGTETLPDGSTPARSTSRSTLRTTSRPNGCCRPPIRSTTTSTPSPTRPRPGAAAPSRSPST